MEVLDKDALGIALLKALEDSQIFAVVDAAHFEFLQDTLIAERLNFDPLYLDEIENPAIASGPHLVYVTGPSQISKLREIIGEEPACVWWAWPDVPNAGKAIHRHLRGLNMVEVPKDRHDFEEPEFDDSERARSHYEPVLFRHADPNVMMSLLVVLYPEQISRMLGDATAIIVDAPNYEQVRTFPRPDVLEAAPRGMLRVQGTEQYDALCEESNRLTRTETFNFLRDNAAEEVADLSDLELKSAILRAERRGLELGLESLEAHSLFAFLSISTGEQALTAPEIADAFEQEFLPPDDVMLQMFDAMIDAAEQDVEE